MIEGEVAIASPGELRAYLQGALKDGTYSRLHRTHRFCQRERSWLETLVVALGRLGHRGWIYREGSQRQVHVCETSADFLTSAYDARILIGTPEGIAYARGYFDAEGGMPRGDDARLYLQLSQKDAHDLSVLREILESAGIRCGRLHNPSVLIDPGYWRFYVRAAWHETFMRSVSSWHPRKRASMERRLAR